MKNFHFTLVLIYLFSVSCNYDGYRYGCLKFVKKYRDEDFSKFTNIGLSIRSYGRDGITIYISDELDTKVRRYPYMIIFYEDGKGIKKTSCSLSKDSCVFDTIKLNKLAVSFLKYNVRALALDKDKNVFITIGGSERFNVVRFSDRKFIKDEYKEEWYSVDDNWYIKKD